MGGNVGRLLTSMRYELLGDIDGGSCSVMQAVADAHER